MRSAVRNPHRRFVRIVVVAALLASTVLTNFALGWERDINGPGDNEAHTIAVTHTGDVVVAGSLIVDRPGRRSANVGVMKLSGPTGTTLWQRLFLGEARRIVIDAQGNAVLAGFTRGPRFAVIKLAGENGAVRWRHRLRRGIAYATATDARGDVVASGAFSTAGLAAGGGEEGPDWIVLKLARASGAEKWRSVIRGGGVLGVNAAFAVVVDTAGDVIAAGQTNSPTSGPHEDPAITNLTVVKLAGGDGRRIWRYDLTSAAVNASGLAVCRAGGSDRGHHRVGRDRIEPKNVGSIRFHRRQTRREERSGTLASDNLRPRQRSGGHRRRCQRRRDRGRTGS